MHFCDIFILYITNIILIMNNIKSINKKGNSLAITVRAKQGCSQVLSVCKKTVTLSAFHLKKAPFLLKNFFQSKKVTTENAFSMEKAEIPALKGPNPFIESHPIDFHKPITAYRGCISKIGDVAEKVTPSLKNISFLNQTDGWNSLDFVMKKKPQVFLTIADKNNSRKEIKNKLGLLSACLKELNIPVSKEFTELNSVDQTVKQLAFIYEQIEDKRIESSTIQDLLVEADDSILELQDLLENYKKIIDEPTQEETKKFVKNTLKNNPLLAKLAPLTLTSGGAALSAFLIDQQGLLPISWNPNSYISNAILHKAGSLFTQIRSAGNVLNSQENLITVLQNATTVAGTCALATVDYNFEEEQGRYLNYIASGLINQMFAFTFAYAGARFCGSKEKVKGFVENRVSSTIAYKVCNTALDYLGVSFWSNKSISLIASSLINPLLSLTH